MNHPTIYSDGVQNSIQDSPLRVQNKILGALKNMGATGQTITAQSGKKTNVATITADTARKNLFIQNINDFYNTKSTRDVSRLCFVGCG